MKNRIRNFIMHLFGIDEVIKELRETNKKLGRVIHNSGHTWYINTH